MCPCSHLEGEGAAAGLCLLHTVKCPPYAAACAGSCSNPADGGMGSDSSVEMADARCLDTLCFGAAAMGRHLCSKLQHAPFLGSGFTCESQVQHIAQHMNSAETARLVLWGFAPCNVCFSVLILSAIARVQIQTRGVTSLAASISHCSPFPTLLYVLQ